MSTFKLKDDIKAYIQELTCNSYVNDELQLDRICEKLKIDYFECDFDDSKISGMLIKDKNFDKFGIYVNRKHPNVRKRFTIAHELGHYISYKYESHSYSQLSQNNEIEDYAISFRHEGIRSQAEKEANQIAAEMLMPELRVKEMAERKLTIKEMADLFFVSESAMTIRLQSIFQGLMVV